MIIIDTIQYPVVLLDRENIELNDFEKDEIAAEMTFEKLEKIAQHSVKYLSIVPHSIHLEMRAEDSVARQYSAVVRSAEGNNYRVMLSYKRYAYLKKNYRLPESDKWGEIDSSKLEDPNGYEEVDYSDQVVQDPTDGLEI